MRYTPLLLLFLVSCQRWSWSGAADALLPDEFTVGQGSSSMLTHTTGGYIGHQDMYVDHMVAEEGLDDAGGVEVEETMMISPISLNLRPGASLPPKEVLWSILVALLLVGIFIRYKAKAARRRW